MLQLENIRVYHCLDEDLDKLFNVKYDTIKNEEKITYLNIYFTHNNECAFYNYELKDNILKLYFIHEDIIKCSDILLIEL